MGLNESKGNMYDFVTHTWNTVKGRCPHDCSYCYMKRWGKQRPMHFDRKELKTDLGEGNFIFVGSSCDMWADEVPTDWIIDTMDHCANFENRYLFQTKNPRRMLDLTSGNPWVSKNVVICTTIETNRFYREHMGKTEDPMVRSYYFNRMGNGVEKHITIEPIMDFDHDELIRLICSAGPIAQVNIGADSGRNNLPEPPFEKVLELVERLKGFTKVVKKKSLDRLGT